MKRKTTKEILAESFQELARSKRIDKITIKEITDNCGYSPATFYRCFRDKYDLIAWHYAQGTAVIMDRIGDHGYEWVQTLTDGVKRFQNEKEYLFNLFTYTSGHDSFIRYMSDINYNALKKHILSSAGLEDLDMKTDMYVRMYCLGTVNLTCEWIMGRYKVTPEELAEVFEQSLPRPLERYLKQK